MTDEVRLRIFEPFFTTKHGSEVTGTGLGLSTVYGIVHLHRGAITVTSRQAAARVHRYLPKGTLATVAPATSEPLPPGAGLVLVVEDEELLRTLATTALTRLGYRSVTAVDGVQASRSSGSDTAS